MTEINSLVEIQQINNGNTYRYGKISMSLIASTVYLIMPAYIKYDCMKTWLCLLTVRKVICGGDRKQTVLVATLRVSAKR